MVPKRPKRPKKDAKPSKTASTAITMAASAGAAAGKAAFPHEHAVAASVVLTLAAALPGLATAWFQARTVRRWEEYACALLDESEDPDLADARLHADADDPILQGCVVESSRLIAEGLAESVVPVLGRLTRIYRAERRAADDFFRGMRRLLMDLTEEQFATLRDIVVLIDELPFAPESSLIELVYAPLKEGDPLQLNVLALVVEGYGKSSVYTGVARESERQEFPLGVWEHGLPIISALKNTSLGADSVGRRGLPSAVNVFLTLETLRRMRRAIA